MATKLSYTLTKESLSFVWQGTPYTVQKNAPNFEPLRKALEKEDLASIPKHLTVSRSIKEWAKGVFTVEGETFFYNGEKLPSEINGRIINMAAAGEDPRPLLRFYKRLQKNPSFRSVSQLYAFLKHEGIPMTVDGCFLAYKAVTDEYKDYHTKTFDNRPGQIHQMPRNKISDDPRVDCHYGFHVGAIQYASTFGSGDRRIVICKVDPKDVVCVPYDSSQHKMRVAKYQVIGEWNGAKLPSTTFVEDEYNEPDDLETVEESKDTTPCDECGNEIPDSESSEINEYHADSCSLNPKNTVPGPRSEKPKAAPKKAPVKAVEKKASASDKKRPAKFQKLDDMGMKDLLDQSLDDLRQYAFKGLDIVGASKIPGGKVALVSRILEVRKPSKK